MSNERFASVWDAIENTPAEAESMKLRSELMMALKEHIARTGLNQSQAAKLFGRDALSRWRQRLACTWKCASWMPHRTGACWTVMVAALPKLVGDAQIQDAGDDWRGNPCSR